MTDQPRLPEIFFDKTTLDNGLDVIVRRQDRLPLVSVNLWYHVGSKNEERRQRGFAHLFEHLMFEGSEHFPGDYFQPLVRIGAAVNGSTSADRTNYFEDLPSAYVELAFALESDRMGNLLPALTDAKLRVQKDVVKNEYRQNYANRPYGEISRILAEALYPPGHPYSWLTIGVMEEIEAANREEVEAFFRRFYVPSNASLCVVGDVRSEEVFELADRYFGNLGGGSRSLTPWAPPVAFDGDVSICVHDRVELERFYETWHTVAQFDADDAPLLLLGDVLARGRASRLYRRLVVEEELAQSVSAQQSGRELGGTFSIVVTQRPGRSLERARQIALAEIESLVERGPTDEEVERVRNGRVAGFVYALDNIGGFGGVADRLNAYNVYLGDPGKIMSDLERFQAVRPADIARVAKRYLAERPRVRVDVRARGTRAGSAAVDRTLPPVPRAAARFHAPRPLVVRLRCGVPLWIIPRRDLPIVSATAALKAGASAHGPELGGLANLTAAMLDEGTRSWNAHELALATESRGIVLSSNCGWDGSYVGVQCMTQHLAAALDLAADVLLAPSFPENEWTRVHGQTLASLRAERDSAEARAHRAFLRALFDARNPYRMPIDGELGTVGQLSRDAAGAFHRDRYRPEYAAWIVAGDVDAEVIARELDHRLRDWTCVESAPAPAAPTSAPAEPRLLLLDRQGATQAAVQLGHLGLPRHHDDYADLIILNQILGGQFTSRLNRRLREEKGFTYGVRSRFDFRRGAGPFAITTSLQSDRLGEALSDIHTEMTALLGDRPPTAAELADARRALVEGQARQFESPGALVARYAELFVQDLPLDEHALLPERLEAVTVDSLARCAKRHLRPEALVTVVVAEADGVERELDRLGWAPVERYGEAFSPGSD
jgi:predicted Zn-dependent peptidase